MDRTPEKSTRRWWPSKVDKKTSVYRVNWLLFVGGVLLVAIAAVMEHPVLTEHTPQTVGFHSVVFSWKAAIGLLKEIGFALIIAWAVSYLIESKAKQREHDAHEAARKQITGDVVHAVFGLQHEIAYVRKVIEETLQPKVIRKHYTVDYTIERLTADELAELKVDANRFVKLTQISSYTFKNVSQSAVDHLVKYAMPVRGGRLYDFAGVRRARIGSKTYEGAELQAKLTSDASEVYKSYCWEERIKPSRELEIVIEAVSIKELSDSEIWGNAHATYEGMLMTVRSTVPEITRFGNRAYTATKPVAVYENGASNAQWKVTGPILPNDSVVFWWRSSEDDGEPNAGENRNEA